MTTSLPSLLVFSFLCVLGRGIFTFFAKVKSPIQNWILRHIYKSSFCFFEQFRCAVDLKVCKKCLYDPQNFFCTSVPYGYDFDSVEKVGKKIYWEKVKGLRYFALSTKRWKTKFVHYYVNNFFCRNFFTTGFEITVKFGILVHFANFEAKRARHT